MREKDVQKTVTDMLDVYGWEWWHVPAPMVAGRSEWRPYRKAAGLPDIFAFHTNPPRMVILELKGVKGRLSPEQRRFLQLARDVAENAMRFEERNEHGVSQPRKPFGVYVIGPGELDALRVILKSKILT